jgi:RNA polymerase sigma factor (sigma-70 family)
MEASALHAPPSLQRLSLTAPLLRLRSDDQLVALFRAGSEEAFTVIHDRYKQRLFAYVRQMLSSASRADAEDVMQDVFVRAYGALRNDNRDVNLRAWLYRVAHNRCIDHFRRPTPQAADVFDVSRTPLLDPIETAQRREDLQRLVDDVGRLPDQQRSALLMREIDGLAYADIAVALDVTVPAVKSLLVRARVGLAEAIEARDTDCSVIRDDLLASYDRGVKASGRARKHMRECAGCREFRTSLKTLRRSFAALSPVGAFGPLAVAAKALGLSGAGGGAAAGGSAVGGSAAVVGGATACKVAAVVCTAALATGGAAVEMKKLSQDGPSKAKAAKVVKAAAPAVAAVSAAEAAPATVAAPVIARRTEPAAPAASKPEKHAPAAAAEKPADVVAPIVADPVTDLDAAVRETTGGTVAPPAEPVADKPGQKPAEEQQPPAEQPSGEAPTQGDAATADPQTSGGTPSSDGPPPEH